MSQRFWAQMKSLKQRRHILDFELPGGSLTSHLTTSETISQYLGHPSGTWQLHLLHFLTSSIAAKMADVFCISSSCSKLPLQQLWKITRYWTKTYKDSITAYGFVKIFIHGYHNIWHSKNDNLSQQTKKHQQHLISIYTTWKDGLPSPLPCMSWFIIGPLYKSPPNLGVARRSPSILSRETGVSSKLPRPR